MNKKYEIVEDYRTNYAIIKIDDKYNLINRKGKIILNKNYDTIYYSEGFYRVEYTTEFLINIKNLIKEDGGYVTKKWFYQIDNFIDGISRVKFTDHTWNYLKLDGTFLSEFNFKSADEYFIDGIVKVSKSKNRTNFLKKDGTFLSEFWFEYITDFKFFGNEYALMVKTQAKRNFMKKDGTFLFDEWFYYIDTFIYRRGFILLYPKECKFKILDKDGNFISDKLFCCLKDKDVKEYTELMDHYYKYKKREDIFIKYDI